MGKETGIEWTDHTFNPWIGCTKVSPGCANCYAEFATPTRRARAGGRELWGKGKARSRTSEGYWRQPLVWNRNAARREKDLTEGNEGNEGREQRQRARVFCASLADWLDDEVPIEWLADLLKLIHETPNLDWLLLTKRIENFIPRMKAVALRARGEVNDPFCTSPLIRMLEAWNNFVPPKNVWLLVSAENQKWADIRLQQLWRIPAVVRGVSAEPLLGQINFRRNDLKKLDWVIFGGESGAGARACNVDWIRDGVRQCRAAGVAAFVKQLGAKPMQVVANQFHVSPKPLELRDKKGGDWSEWPADLRVREFPESSQKETKGTKL